MRIDNFVCSTLWGTSPHGYSFRPSVGASGGLLIMWAKGEVNFFSSFCFDHVLEVCGRLLKSNVDFVLFNVYAPCDARGQNVLWESLTNILANFDGSNICVCGDFNVVLGSEERRSVTSYNSLEGVYSFNNFIERSALVDLPLIGRQFTWYHGDGHAMSRIDRFLLSENWCLNWPNCIYIAQLQGLSDHFALVLSADEQNWGPKPFRMLKC